MDERTVFEQVKNMSVDEFAQFMFNFYNKAWSDGTRHEDSEGYIYAVYPYQTELYPWDNE